MKKIAFFVGSLSKGGTERVVINLAEYFSRIGTKVCIVTAWKNENEYTLPEGVLRYDVALTKEEWSRNKIKNALRRNRKRESIIREFAPDLIVSFIKENNFKAILTGKKCGVKVVASVRSDPAAEYPTFGSRFIMKRLFTKADGIILQTQAMRDFFPTILQKKIVILPNPIDLRFLKDVTGVTRKKEIVMVGRLDENKNQMLLLEAFSRLAEVYPEWNCVCIGEGACRTKLEEKIKSYGLEQRFFLPGSKTNIQDEIDAASVFVLASRFEGMPNALIEAMALGLAVVSTDCDGGGPRELIRDGENGILIPKDDAEALYEKLKLLFDDDSLRERLGESARKTAERMHPDVVNETWRAYLEEIVIR